MEITVYTGTYGKVTSKGFILENGPVIPLPKANLKILSHYSGMDIDSGKVTIDSRITLVVDDDPKSFWPVIVKMTEEEALKLRDKLTVIVEKRRENPSAQSVEIV